MGDKAVKKQSEPVKMLGPFLKGRVIGFVSAPLMVVLLAFGVDAKLSIIVCFFVVILIYLFLSIRK